MGFGRPGFGRRCLPLRGKVRAAPQGLNVSGLRFFRRRVPSCRRHASHAGKGGSNFLASAALPYGQGALPGCVFDAVCPAGKGAAEWRAVFWRIAEKTGVSVRFAHQETFPARRGTELRDTSHCPTFRGEHSGRGGGRDQLFLFYHLFAPAKSQLSALPAATSSPHHPASPNAAGRRPLRVGRPPCMRFAAGTETKHPSPLLVGLGRVNTPPTALAADTVGTAGSARTRSRVQTLENPFLGSSPVFLVSRLQNRRLLPPLPHPTRTAAHPPPARGAGVRRI